MARTKKDSLTSFYPKTPNQELYLNSMKTCPVIFATGCAGTGKTYLALNYAADLLTKKLIDQIIITRPNVSTSDKTLGYFKGTKDEKIAEWMSPAIKILKKALTPQKFSVYFQSGKIIFEPLETMRGETFDDAFVLLDEAQNVTYNDLKMFLTRIGTNTKVVIDGDTQQTDLKGRSGLLDVISMVKNSPLAEFPVINFTIDDVVRSSICKVFIQMFEQHRVQPVLQHDFSDSIPKPPRVNGSSYTPF